LTWAGLAEGHRSAIVFQRNKDEIAGGPIGATLHDQSGRPEGIVGGDDAITVGISVKPGVGFGALRAAGGVPSKQGIGWNAAAARDGPTDQAHGIAFVVAGRVPDRALVIAGFPTDLHFVFASLVDHVVPATAHVRAAEEEAWRGHGVTVFH
jgi:hypothetical protein